MGDLVDVGMNKLEMASYKKYINSLNIYAVGDMTRGGAKMKPSKPQSNVSPFFDREYLDPVYQHYIIVMLIITNTFQMYVGSHILI